MDKDFGMLNLNSDKMTYTYKNETYQLYSHPYEPCLYLYRGDELVCTLHNAYNPEQLVKAFSAGETVKTNYGKDYDKEFDEAGFCRVLAAALNSGRDNMDLFDASNMSFGDLGEKKMAIFAVIPDNDTSLSYLVGMLYTQIIQELYFRADHIHYGALPMHVRFVLDEFANVSLPEEFDKSLATMRSRNMSATIIVQNLAQLKGLYKDGACLSAQD